MSLCLKRIRKSTVTKVTSLLLSVSCLIAVAAGCGKNPEVPDETTNSTLSTYDIPVEQEDENVDLGQGLVLTDVGKYTGIYMEDGSDEVVTGLLMIILKNDSPQDLQLARLQLKYTDFVAQFEVTNLPSGQSVVLLEKNRHSYVEGDFLSASMDDVVFFQEPMSLQEDQLKISGEKGSICVENLTDEPLGEMYIYYKNSAADILYGGITYRARVDGRLEAKEIRSVLTRHYNPDTCTIVNVQIVPLSETE